MSNYIENQIDAAFAGHGWPTGKDAPALLMDAACELRQLRGNLSQFRKALEMIRDGEIPQAMSPALFAEFILRGPLPTPDTNV